MSYFLDLFSPQTYEAFKRTDKTVSGFRLRHRGIASRVKPGDKLMCYMTKLSRWFGLLRVIDGPYIDDTPVPFADDTPVLLAESDPFVVRFHVEPIIWLPVEKAVPIHENLIWDSLSFTRGQNKASSTWTGKLRGSLAQLTESDGELLESVLSRQVNDGISYPFQETEYQRHIGHRVRLPDRDISVTVPEESEADEADIVVPQEEVRESIRIQALLAEIGSHMGFQIWLPKADRTAVTQEWRGDHAPVMDRLPLNYDDVTLRTIEQIDVLWLRGRSIKRAFEVEHTTSIHSGILRMADLLALQPNMDIRLHIVAPAARRLKVFQQIKRPVFSLLDRGPLSESCTFLSYDSIRELAAQPHLTHLSDTVIEEYEEEPED